MQKLSLQMRLREQIKTIFPDISFSDPFGAVYVCVRHLSVAGQSRIMAFVQLWIAHIGKNVTEKDCVLAAKILVALLPISLSAIRSCLQQNSPAGIYELHFSLFCFFDDILYYSNLKKYRTELLALVKGYLETVNTDCALAAWMAGDLLGDHWNPRESVPVLCALHRNAKHTVARSAIRHGLEMAAMRKLPVALRSQTQKCLKETH